MAHITFWLDIVTEHSLLASSPQVISNAMLAIIMWLAATSEFQKAHDSLLVNNGLVHNLKYYKCRGVMFLGRSL